MPEATGKRPRGRPVKAPTSTALDPWDYVGILVFLAVDRYAPFRPAFNANPEAWATFIALNLLQGLGELVQLCRRYVPNKTLNTPKLYVSYFLGKRVAKPFRRRLAKAMAALPDPTVDQEPRFAKKPPAPTGRRRSDVGAWTPLEPPQRTDAIFAHIPSRRVEVDREPFFEALAGLSHAPDVVDAVVDLTQRRNTYGKDLHALRERIAQLKVDRSVAPAVKTVLDMLGGPVGRR